MKKWKVFLSAVFILFLALSSFLYLYLKSFIPQKSGIIQLEELNKAATVYYDSFGIPHIEASNEEDAFYALGYTHASDRLFQMEILRRLAKGELASILGKDLVKIDKFFRTIGVRKVAKKVVSRMDHSKPQFKVLNSYVAGINSYMENGKTIEHKMIGIPLIPFTLEDTIAISGYMAISFSQAFKIDPVIQHLKKNLPKEFYEDFLVGLDHDPSIMKEKFAHKKPLKTLFLDNFRSDVLNPLTTMLPGAPIFIGSNAWVISGEMTKSGLPILANDPHIGFASPSVWYEAHIKTPKFELYGHYIAGIPLAPIGHTPNKAWGMTMLQNDDMFFYEEKPNPNNPSQVSYKGKWENLRHREEIIKIKGSKPIKITVAETSHGPVINQIVDNFRGHHKPISLWWSFLNPENDLISAFYQLAHEEDFKKIPKHLEQVYSPGLNLLYADNKNNIAWWPLAKIPVLPKGFKTKELMDGSKEENEITEYIPFNETPQAINPPENLIVSANSDPSHISQTKHKIPGYYCNKQRYLRIKDLLLSHKSPWTLEAMKSVQLDDKDFVHQKVTAQLVKSLEEVSVKKEIAKISNEAIQILKTWEGTHKSKELAPGIYYAFLSEIVTFLFEDKIPEELYEPFLRTHHVYNFLENIILKKNSIWWTASSSTTNQAKILVSLWERSLKRLEDFKGKNINNWEWKKLHMMEHIHPVGRKKPLNYIFNVGPKGTEGGYEVVNNQKFNLSNTLPFEIRSGPSTRRLIDLSNTKLSLGINPTGQSGYFFDKHYKDQFDLYREGQYRDQIMDMNLMKENYSEKLILQPKL